MTKHEREQIKLLNKGISALIERNKIRLNYYDYTNNQKVYIKGMIYAYEHTQKIITTMLLKGR